MLSTIADVHNTKHYRAWEKFHSDNPDVYRKLVDLCEECRIIGLKKFGMRALWERMRWYFQVELGEEAFKLNDHYPPYYARFIMERHPELRGFFETRDRN
jgi:hypothetical protein